MSGQGRLSYGAAAAAAPVLDPQWVSAHRGDRNRFLWRHRRQARHVLLLGRAGRQMIAPHLLHRVSDERALRAAWDYLQAHGGQAPGPDGLRYEDLGDGEVWQLCRELRDDIRAGVYEPDEEEVRWIPKGPGRGSRPLVLQSIFDRVVQRAAVTILQPLLDPLFDRNSFGFRPRKDTLQALAAAERLAVGRGQSVWVAADVKDAFGHVPLPRLLGVVRKYLADDGLEEFIGKVVSGAKTPGLRQGGPLSPLLLNLYLHHHLDKRWRRLHPDVGLIRYADDILLLCRTSAEAEGAYDDLVGLLRPAGMALKEDRATAVRALTSGAAVEWMGFRITQGADGLRFGLTEGGWWGLIDNLALAHEEPNSPLRAILSIAGWIGQKGPCYPTVDHDGVYDRIRALARKQAFDEIPSRAEVKDLWQRAFARWAKLRAHAAAMHLGD